MYVRLNTLTGVKDIEAAVAYLEEVTLSVVQASGYKGATAAANQAEEIIAILTVWETAADREASNSALAKVRDEGRAANSPAASRWRHSISGPTWSTSVPPSANSVMMTRVTMDPGSIAEIVARTEQVAVPKIQALPRLPVAADPRESRDRRRPGGHGLGTTRSSVRPPPRPPRPSAARSPAPA